MWRPYDVTHTVSTEDPESCQPSGTEPLVPVRKAAGWEGLLLCQPNRQSSLRGCQSLLMPPTGRRGEDMVAAFDIQSSTLFYWGRK